jgi:antigen flippase
MTAARFSSAFARIRRTLGRIRPRLGGGSSSGAALQTALTRALLLGLNLATSIVVAHFLGPTGRGELSALVLWPPLLASIFSLGVPWAFLYYERKDPEDRDTLFSAAMLLTTLLSVVMVVAGWFILPLLLNQYSVHIVQLARWILFLAPEVMLSYITSAVFQTSNRFGAFNLQRYLPVVATFVSLLVVERAGWLNSVTAGLCYAIPPVPIFFWALFRLRGTVRFTFAKWRDATLRLVNYGSRASGISLLGTIAQQVDQVMVISLLSAASMGIYAVALSASRVPNFVFMAMTDAISAKSMGLPVQQMTAFVGRASRMGAVGSTICAVALGLALPLLLPLLYGSAFRQSIPVTEVLLLEVIASGTGSVLAVAYLAAGRPGLVTFVQGGSLLISVPLMLLLIPRLGLMGAAISLLISSSARVAAMLTLYRMAVGTSPPGLLITVSDIRFLVDRVRGLRPAAA